MEEINGRLTALLTLNKDWKKLRHLCWNAKIDSDGKAGVEANVLQLTISHGIDLIPQ